MDADRVVDQGQLVLEVFVQRTKRRNFILDKPRNCGNTLQTVYTDIALIIRFRAFVMPFRVVEIYVSPSLASTQQEFDIRNLLRFGPDMTTLEIRVEL